MGKQQTEVVAKWLSYIIAGILVVLPFHALLTTWAGSNLGNIDAWRIWKELLIFAMAPAAIWLALKQPSLKNWLGSAWLPRLLLAYAILMIVSGWLALRTGNVNSEALVYGLLANLRFFGFFAICIVIAVYNDFLRRYWWKILLAPAVIVMSFGLLQLLLPLDFLTHFGYGPETIPAYQTVDEKLDYRRLQSTLRGANPLGAYLVLVISGLLVWRPKRTLKRLFLAAGLVVLWLTYSRSAYIGVLVSAVALFWSQGARFVRKNVKLVAGLGAAVLACVILLAPIWTDIDIVQNTLFHSDEKSSSAISSNAGRTLSLRKSSLEVVLEPLGQGVGTAGPASVRNDKPARIAENYFLQLGQEAGWLTIGLFIAINISVARLLWHIRTDKKAQIMLVSLLGITIINLVSHAWMDDTLSLLWWGLAGVVIGSHKSAFRRSQKLH